MTASTVQVPAEIWEKVNDFIKYTISTVGHIVPCTRRELPDCYRNCDVAAMARECLDLIKKEGLI